MKPPPFAYSAPSTVPEAVALLVEHADEEPRVLAGGQSLVPLMNFRLAQPGRLVDLRRVAGLEGIRMDGDVLVLGAMVRQAVAERSPEVTLAAPLLAEAHGHVAHLPVRNSGTVGGSLAHVDRAAELPTVALAPDATTVRLPAAEEALQGTRGDAAAVAAAVDAAAAGLQPAADVHEGSKTRIDIARDVLRRGIDRALERARDRR